MEGEKTFKVMKNAAFIVVGISVLAFLFALLFGKSSIDEPLEEGKCGELENHETFWHK